MKKRLLSALLAVCLVVGMVPATLLTAGAATEKTPIESLSIINSAITAGVEAGEAVPELKDITITNYSVTEFKATSGYSKGVWSANQIPKLTIKFTYDPVTQSITAATLKAALDTSYSNWTWAVSTSGSSCTLTATYKSGAENTQTTASGAETNKLKYIDDMQVISVTQDTVTVVKGKSVTVNAIANITEGGTENGDILGGGGTVSGVVPEDYKGYIKVDNKSGKITITGLNVTPAAGVTLDLTAAISGNYAAVTDEAAITVKVVDGATVTVKANKTTFTYGDSASTSADLLATAVVGGVTVSKDNDTSSGGTWTWTSSNENVATVANGIITPVSAGTAEITATYNDGTDDLGVSSPVKITVEKATIAEPIVHHSETLPYLTTGHDFTSSDYITVPNASLWNGATGDYTVSPSTNVVASGTHTVTVALKDPNNYMWAHTKNSNNLTYKFTIGQKALVNINDSSIGVTITNSTAITYDGSDPDGMKDAIAGAVKITQDSSYTLVNGVDYTLSYSTPTVGVLYLTVNGIGNYSGSRIVGYVNIAAGSFTVGSTGALTVVKGSSVNLANALSITGTEDNDASDISAAKLQNLTFTLANEADAAYAKISGTTLTPTSDAGDGQPITVKATYGSSYNVGGDSKAEYTTTSTTTTITVTVRASNMVTKVTAPTGSTGLVYNGKAQTLVNVPNGALYTVDVAAESDVKTAGNVINEATATAINAGTYKITLTLKDRTATTNKTTPVWSDGTSGTKIIYVKIAKADPTGVPSYTNVKDDNVTLKSAILQIGSIKGVNGDTFTVDGTNVTLDWDYTYVDEATVISEGVGYTWVFDPGDTSNYNKLTGTIVLWGDAAKEEEKEEEEDDEEDWETTVTNPDGSVTVTKYDGETKVTTATTTGTYTSSVVQYKNGVLSSITASSTRAGAVAYIPLSSSNVRWDSLVYVNGSVEYDALPADGLTGFYVPLPYGSSTLKVTHDGYIFTDVNVNSWYGPSVYVASARDLIRGTSLTTYIYEPTTTLNRGQIMTMLARYSGTVTIAQSSGVNWYAAGANFCLSTGVTAENRYNDAATREEVAVMLYNYYRNVLGGSAYSGTTAAYAFTDYSAISTAARDAVAWCYANGIITGYTTDVTTNTFAPTATIKRQEAACMIARFMYVVNGMPIPSAID